MAIALDSNSGVHASSNTTSYTFSHTTSGSDRFLIVWGYDVSGVSSGVSSITYNGTAMTKAIGRRTPSDRWITIWYLANPDTGTNNVTITVSPSTYLRFNSVSYTGVDQSTPIDGSFDSDDGTGVTTVGTSITTSNDNSWMFLATKDNAGGKTSSSSTGDTNRVNTDAGGLSAWDTGGVITPAGANAMTISWSGIANVSAVSLAFNEATAAPPAATDNALAFCNF